jgi:formylglycine-generating enzyme required for sulfatase activity
MSAPEGEPAAPRRRPRSLQLDQLFDSLQQEAPKLENLRTNRVGIKLALIPAGTFMMGSPPSEPQHRANEAPVHEVILTQPFYLSVTPITQEQYQKVMGTNPARFTPANGGGPEHPVEQVSWDDALAFCDKLTSLGDGLRYRLPTEAEWEFACRAGTTTAFSAGPELSASVANILGRKTSRVAFYPANNFGLFDMHGNVWEWCSDYYGEAYYAKAPSRNPSGPSDGEFRVVRGGSWRNHAGTCRSAYRNALVPHNRDPYTGFRVAATAAS